MSMATTIRLYGEAGRRFGRAHRAHLDTGSVAEAMAYLKSQIRGIEAYFTQAKDRGLTFAVFHGKKNIGADDLREPSFGADIRIAPIIQGSKANGALQTILGVVLIVVGAILSFIPGGQAAAPYFYSAGIAMVAGGVVQLLTPHPKGLASKDSPDNQANYAFNGPVNTQAQGNPVGVLYGEMIVGSAVISASISAQDAAYVPTTSGTGNMGIAGNIRNMVSGG